MLATIFGIILILIPFLLVFSFSDRRQGFLYVFSAVLILHSFIALFTQFFHLFSYTNLIMIHSLIACLVIGFFIYRFKQFKFNFKLNFLVILGFLIVFFNFYSVHFFYNGYIATINHDQKQVDQSVYQYPYFSDEWIGVAWINYTIDNNELPIKNPLIDKHDSYFPNIFIGFFSLISEIFLILNVNPLTAYIFVSLAFNLILCFLFFLLLRVHRVNSFIALLATLFIPYITNGSNLPGTWYFIPFSMGLITILLNFIFLELKKPKIAFLIGVFSLFLYPPFLVFVIPAFLIYFFSHHSLKDYISKKTIGITISSLLLIVFLIIYSQPENAKTLWQILFNSFWRLNLDGGIPTFYPWLILPLVIFPFTIFGFVKLIKEKKYYIFITTLISFSLWGFYMISQYYIFIDYARVVIFSALLLLFLFGLGLEYLLNKFIEKSNLKISKTFIVFFKIIIIFCFFILSLFYTSSNNWEKLKLKSYQTSDFYLSPNPPANFYLHQDDISLFSGITKSRFLAPPWKALVVGVATNNYPLHSKASIITNNYLDYYSFIDSPCEDKKKLAKKHKIVYVYSNYFVCDGFTEVGNSNEGLYLYKFNDK